MEFTDAGSELLLLLTWGEDAASGVSAPFSFQLPPFALHLLLTRLGFQQCGFISSAGTGKSPVYSSGGCSLHLCAPPCF